MNARPLAGLMSYALRFVELTSEEIKYAEPLARGLSVLEVGGKYGHTETAAAVARLEAKASHAVGSHARQHAAQHRTGLEAEPVDAGVFGIATWVYQLCLDGLPMGEAKLEIERCVLLLALADGNGCAAAARILGEERSTIAQKMKRRGLKGGPYDDPSGPTEAVSRAVYALCVGGQRLSSVAGAVYEAVIHLALADARNNLAEAARKLGMTRSGVLHQAVKAGLSWDKEHAA